MPVHVSFFIVVLLELCFTPGVNQENEYDRLPTQEVSEGQTAELTLELLSFVNMSFYLTRENDLDTKIFYYDGKSLFVYDKDFETEGLQHGILKVRIRNVTSEYKDKYFLTTYVNRKLNTTYYFYLVVKSQNKSQSPTKDEDPKDPTHKGEHNNTLLLALVVGVFTLVAVMIVGIIVYYVIHRGKSRQPDDPNANAEELGSLNQAE